MLYCMGFCVFNYDYDVYDDGTRGNSNLRFHESAPQFSYFDLFLPQQIIWKKQMCKHIFSTFQIAYVELAIIITPSKYIELHDCKYTFLKFIKSWQQREFRRFQTWKNESKPMFVFVCRSLKPSKFKLTPRFRKFENCVFIHELIF